MLGWIWLGMIVFSLVSAVIFGRLGLVSNGVLDAAKVTVMDVMLPQAGFIAFWMGILRLVEQSGFIHLISRFLSPVLRILFPGIPAGHPALGSIALNLGASMLGASNAATPAGLRAMAQMQQLNPNKQFATNEMCMLLVLSTVAISIIPASSIRVLHAAHHDRATSIILPALFATAVASLAGVLLCKFLQGRKMFAVPPADREAETATATQVEAAPPEPKKLAPWKWLVLFVLLGLPLAYGAAYVFNPDTTRSLHEKAAVFLETTKARQGADSSTLHTAALAKVAELGIFKEMPPTPFGRFALYLSQMTIPLFIAFFVLYGALSGLKIFGEFVEGAKDGVGVALRVIPYVVAILVAIRMLRESGGLDLIQGCLSPLMTFLHFPPDLLPIAIVRPLSGGAASGLLADVAKEAPNSLEALMAGAINGSADTTFYVAAVYFGSVGIQRMRHAVHAGLFADIVAIIMAVVFTGLICG